jgi:hypothetical protein
LIQRQEDNEDSRTHSCSQTLFLTFPLSKASLIVEGRGCQRVSSAFASWKGDGCMKDTDHRIRHPRVHLGDRASAQRSESYARQNAQDGRGTAAYWAGATPLFATGSWPKDNGVAPAQPIGRALKTFRWTGRGSSDAVFSRRAGRTSSFLLVFLNNRGRGEELFTPLLHGGFTNHFTGSAAPCLGKSMRYTLQKVPSCTHTGTMGWRERPHPLTHGASPVS